MKIYEGKANNIYNYDSDWSEVEDLIDGMDTDTADIEETLLNKIVKDFGTLALVFYHRLKESKDLQEQVFSLRGIPNFMTDNPSCKSILLFIKKVLRR